MHNIIRGIKYKRIYTFTKNSLLKVNNKKEPNLEPIEEKAGIYLCK